MLTYKYTIDEEVNNFSSYNKSRTIIQVVCFLAKWS